VVAIAAALLLIADGGTELAGGSTFPGGPLDEAAHLLTALLVLWAVGGRACERFLVPALIASVAIDLDHIPQRLGSDWLSGGTPRPYTHSLLTLAIVLLAALLWRRRRDVMLGLAIGLALHLWRDMSEPESGVALFWPLSKHSVTMPHSSYLIVMAAVIATAAWRSWPRRAAARAVPVPQE
jgi:inner membrane protein